MASELRVNTLKDAAGNNSVGMEYVANGSAKAWCNFNGTGTIASRDSLNVSSLTDVGTGNYTSNYTSAYAAADYAINGSVKYNSGVAFDGVYSVEDQQAGNTSVYSVYGGTLFDSTIVSILSTGDLA